MRILILEILRQGPSSVGQLPGGHRRARILDLAAARRPAQPQHRGHGATRHHGHLQVRDPELFDLLDVARRIFNGSLADTIDMLRLVDAEPASASRE